MRSLEHNTLKKNTRKKSEELLDEMQTELPKRKSLNDERGVFGGVFDAKRSLNLSQSVFDREAVFKSKP